MPWRNRLFLAPAVLVGLLAVPATATAYSVLAHEALIDSAWDDQIVPLLKARFPRATADALRAARAYAYGGSLIQDLGYYPFGSRFFSNLVHYVRSGDFVESLIRESQDVNELAFAFGALAHFASDTVGHPRAVNRAVPLVYPKIRQKHGPEALYAHSPTRHVMVEFAFDVSQVARGTFKADAYQDLVGFHVAPGLLDKTFRATYGFRLTDVFADVEMAIGTYRRAASEIIPDVTRMACRELLQSARAGTLAVNDADLDTGRTPAQGVNPLADETYDELLAELADTNFVSVSVELRRAINQHYNASSAEPRRKPSERTARQVAALNGVASND
jgi:hypothetical protein